MTPLTDAHDAPGPPFPTRWPTPWQVGPAIVQVNGRPRRPASGVVYAPTLVVAADHAVEREDDLTVEMATGAALPAQVVGLGPRERSRRAPRARPRGRAGPTKRPVPPAWDSSSSPWAARAAVSSWPASES